MSCCGELREAPWIARRLRGGVRGDARLPPGPGVSRPAGGADQQQEPEYDPPPDRFPTSILARHISRSVGLPPGCSIGSPSPAIGSTPHAHAPPASAGGNAPAGGAPRPAPEGPVGQAAEQSRREATGASEPAGVAGGAVGVAVGVAHLKPADGAHSGGGGRDIIPGSATPPAPAAAADGGEGSAANLRATPGAEEPGAPSDRKRRRAAESPWEEVRPLHTPLPALPPPPAPPEQQQQTPAVAAAAQEL